MAIMASLNPKSDCLYDPIRKRWVAKTPEESIRQSLIVRLVAELGYSPSLLAVEKELYQLPHLHLMAKKEMPKRRVDLIAFAQNIHPGHALFPLLMIECKAVDLTPAFAQQVIGYNAFVQAPFLALANGKEVLTGFFDECEGVFRFEPGLFSYQMLVEKVQKKREFEILP